MVVKIITEFEYFYQIVFVNNIAGETNKSHFRSNEQMHFTKKTYEDNSTQKQKKTIYTRFWNVSI